MDRYWPYISAMLMNLGGMKVDRVHSTLEIFVSDYQGNIDLLIAYLDQKVKGDALLRTEEGTYLLPGRQ